jgi:hypothetical protein
VQNSSFYDSNRFAVAAADPALKRASDWRSAPRKIPVRPRCHERGQEEESQAGFPGGKL